ncbi:hypothetical protein GCM10010171_43070 [Actinokineospora fastidiosa]|uniref:Uncharacterized protein n=2 Tax=Actinokineospora fastidiosa TaxID=1816 RepID=A0A918GK57_9PSEU|nr:hypothetical protein GCM10010171_43070 [Actinokineospora fastidiosa]
MGTAYAMVDHGWAPGTAGLAVVLTHYDAFAASWPDLAWAMLDLMAEHSRVAALMGRRLLCLVHSSDPDLSFEPVGAAPVLWNPAEWLDAVRREG